MITNNKIRKNIFFYFVILIITLFIINKTLTDDYYDYPLFFVVDSCTITLTRQNPSKKSSDEILKGREKYRVCMNFVMSLSTTLNSRCMAVEKKSIKPEETFTYADLSEVHATQDLINAIIEYSKKYPHFINQIAWLHASKAISQKWPCKKF